MPVALGVNGGILGSNNLPSSGSAKGIWTPNEIARAIGLGFWPLVYARTVTETSSGADNIVTVEPDPFFEYTTLLLPGNGTNGAQNNTFLDSSSNNFTITRNPTAGPNAPTQGTFSPFSQTGWGNYFGTASTKIATTSMTQLGSDFTLELWVYPQSFADYNTIFDNRTSDADSGGFVLGLTSAAKVYFYSNSSFLLTTTGTISANTWTHIALVRSGSGSGNVKIYINGIADATTATYTTSFTRTAPSIGDDWNTRSTLQYYGYMSNLRATTGALYTSNFTPSTIPLTTSVSTGTVVLLTCQSNRFRDASASSLTITATGSPSVQAFSPFNPTAPWSAAIYGGSGYFDGTGDYLTSPSSSAYLPSTTTTPFTLECWVYNTGTSATLLYSALALENYGFVLGFGSGVGTYDSTATPWFAYYSGSWSGIRSTVSIPINAWTHIACVFTGSTCLIFQNGVQTASGGPSTWPSFAASVLRIGCRPDAINVFTGYISGVRIVNGTAVYTAGFTPPTAPVTAITNTSLLLNFTNAGIYNATSKNDLETVGNAQISTTQSKWGGSSMSFDGTGDYLLSPDQPIQRIGTGNFTIEGWVYRNSTGTYGLIGKGTSTTGWLVSLNSSNQVVFTYGSSTITSSGTVSATTWTHIAVVREGTSTNQTKIYINGTNDGTGTVSTDFNQTNSMYVGADRTAGSAANAYMQDVRVTNYARYTANFTAPTAAFPTL